KKTMVPMPLAGAADTAGVAAAGFAGACGAEAATGFASFAGALVVAQPAATRARPHAAASSSARFVTSLLNMFILWSSIASWIGDRERNWIVGRDLRVHVGARGKRDVLAGDEYPDDREAETQREIHAIRAAAGRERVQFDDLAAHIHEAAGQDELAAATA